MRVMIGYDGSHCVETAIDDLLRAGLPGTGEMLVVTAEDISETMIKVPPEPGTVRELVMERFFARAVTYARISAQRLRSKTKKLARQGHLRVQSLFPKWKVREAVVVGEAADALLTKADEWKPDLIVVGSNGRSSLGRFFLGSVSKAIAESASCPVRIGRMAAEKNGEKPILLVAGSTTLAGIDLLVRTLGRRTWPEGTAIHLTKIDDGKSADGSPSAHPNSHAVIEQAVEKLSAPGLTVSPVIKKGDLTSVLLDEASIRGADAISFSVDPENKTRLRAETARLITQAPCSIEIIH